jgi:hypothetical protein
MPKVVHRTAAILARTFDGPLAAPGMTITQLALMRAVLRAVMPK